MKHRLQASLNEAEAFLSRHPTVNWIDLLINDMHGTFRGKRIHRSQLIGCYEKGTYFARSIYAGDLHGTTVEATGLGLRSGEPDFRCWPLANTLCVKANSPTQGQCCIAMEENDEQWLNLSPWGQLEQVYGRLQQHGWQIGCAVELEFYLSESAGQPPQNLEQRPQLYGLHNLDRYPAFFDQISIAAEQQHIPISALVAEYSNNQYEANLQHRPDPMLAALDAMRLKYLIHTCANKMGLSATFMAQPFMDHPGNGCHIHISLYDQQHNNLFSHEVYGRKTMESAIAGLMQTAADYQLFFAPNLNSYRRYYTKHYVSEELSWGYNHRGAAIRIPPTDSDNMRIEHRIAGADANPALVISAVMAGVLKGIDENLIAQPPLPNNHPNSEFDLAHDWFQSMSRFESSKNQQQGFDTAFCELYLDIKRDELGRFQHQVGQLENQWYWNS